MTFCGAVDYGSTPTLTFDLLFTSTLKVSIPKYDETVLILDLVLMTAGTGWHGSGECGF